VVNPSTLDLIYANTQYIVESIKSRKVEKASTVEKLPMSQLW
jgi:hypothetical protein